MINPAKAHQYNSISLVIPSARQIWKKPDVICIPWNPPPTSPFSTSCPTIGQTTCALGLTAVGLLHQAE